MLSPVTAGWRAGTVEPASLPRALCQLLAAATGPLAVCMASPCPRCQPPFPHLSPLGPSRTARAHTHTHTHTHTHFPLPALRGKMISKVGSESTTWSTLNGIHLIQTSAWSTTPARRRVLKSVHEKKKKKNHCPLSLAGRVLQWHNLASALSSLKHSPPAFHDQGTQWISQRVFF